MIKHKKINASTNKLMDPLKPNLDSSLAHLAYGYNAFRAWREMKNGSNEKK